jgi:tRNA pseudouridine38-40 synthase
VFTLPEGSGDNPPVRILRLVVEYDGADFAGWAAQPGLRTIEDTLAAGLRTVLREDVRLSVAGRTDAGVHATGQVVSIATTNAIPARRLLKACPALLPHDVSVRSVEEMPEGFDARRDAVARRYEYRILTGPPSPLRRGRVLQHPGTLDLDALSAAARLIEGRHDFRAFTPSQTEHVFFARTVHVCRWDVRDDELVLTIEANAFLRHMVRILVGTVLLVGRGLWTVDRLTPLLRGAPRGAAGPTAPPHPLTLVGVTYRDRLDRRSGYSDARICTSS